MKSEPETVALSALAYIAGDEKLMNRFLALTGIEASEIRQAAREPGFLAGVLQFIAAHEPTLMDFSDHASLAPQEVVNALHRLPGGRGDEWLST